MNKKIQLRVNEEMYNFIEKYRFENNFDDDSDALREIIKREMKRDKSIFYKIKIFFNFN